MIIFYWKRTEKLDSNSTFESMPRALYAEQSKIIVLWFYTPPGLNIPQTTDVGDEFSLPVYGYIYLQSCDDSGTINKKFCQGTFVETALNIL